MLRKVMIGMAFLMSILTLSVLTFWGATESKAQTTKDTSPFEYEIVSEVENTCCITGIRITKDEGISELEIPGTINGKTVVSIGVGEILNTYHQEVDQNAFLMYQDPDFDEPVWISDPGIDGVEQRSEEQERRAKNIKKIILPDTIKEIKAAAFAGLSGLESIELPEGLTTIGRSAFDGTSIKKIHFPSSLTTIEGRIFYKNSPLKDINIPAKLKDGVAELARLKVSWKSFTISKENPYYKIKKGLLLSKDGKILYATVTSNKNIRIPDKVQTIDSCAFYGRSLKSVYLGAGIKEIKANALATESRCKVTLSPKNPYLAKSGMCIYHKKKRNLLVGIPKSYYARISAKIKKQKLYYLRIPKKVKKLGKSISIVGIKPKYLVKKLYYPKSIKKIPSVNYRWDMGLLIHIQCVYIKF